MKKRVELRLLDGSEVAPFEANVVTVRDGALIAFWRAEYANQRDEQRIFPLHTLLEAKVTEL